MLRLKELFKDRLAWKFVLFSAVAVFAVLVVYFAYLVRYTDSAPGVAAIEAFVWIPLRVLVLCVVQILFFVYIYPRISGSK